MRCGASEVHTNSNFWVADVKRATLKRGRNHFPQLADGALPRPSATVADIKGKEE